MGDPAKAVAEVATCMKISPELSSFEVGLKPILLSFIGALPALPGLLVPLPPKLPPVNPPKVLVEFVIGAMSGLKLPPIKISLPDIDVSAELGSPDFEIPTLSGVDKPAFDPQVLVDFILGLIKIVIKLPTILPPLGKPDLPGIGKIVTGAIPGAAVPFGECLAKAILAVIV